MEARDTQSVVSALSLLDGEKQENLELAKAFYGEYLYTLVEHCVSRKPQDRITAEHLLSSIRSEAQPKVGTAMGDKTLGPGENLLYLPDTYARLAAP